MAGVTPRHQHPVSHSHRAAMTLADKLYDWLYDSYHIPKEAMAGPLDDQMTVTKLKRYIVDELHLCPDGAVVADSRWNTLSVIFAPARGPVAPAQMVVECDHEKLCLSIYHERKNVNLYQVTYKAGETELGIGWIFHTSEAASRDELLQTGLWRDSFDTALDNHEDWWPVHVQDTYEAGQEHHEFRAPATARPDRVREPRVVWPAQATIGGMARLIAVWLGEDRRYPRTLADALLHAIETQECEPIQMEVQQCPNVEVQFSVEDNDRGVRRVKYKLSAGDNVDTAATIKFARIATPAVGAWVDVETGLPAHMVATRLADLILEKSTLDADLSPPHMQALVATENDRRWPANLPVYESGDHSFWGDRAGPVNEDADDVTLGARVAELCEVLQSDTNLVYVHNSVSVYFLHLANCPNENKKWPMLTRAAYPKIVAAIKAGKTVMFPVSNLDHITLALLRVVQDDAGKEKGTLEIFDSNLVSDPILTERLRDQIQKTIEPPIVTVKVLHMALNTGISRVSIRPVANTMHHRGGYCVPWVHAAAYHMAVLAHGPRPSLFRLAEPDAFGALTNYTRQTRFEWIRNAFFYLAAMPWTVPNGSEVWAPCPLYTWGNPPQPPVPNARLLPALKHVAKHAGLTPRVLNARARPAVVATNVLAAFTGVGAGPKRKRPHETDVGAPDAGAPDAKRAHSYELEVLLEELNKRRPAWLERVPNVSYSPRGGLWLEGNPAGWYGARLTRKAVNGWAADALRLEHLDQRAPAAFATHGPALMAAAAARDWCGDGLAGLVLAALHVSRALPLARRYTDMTANGG